MKLIVGLGNPGNQYRDTRHNLGFQVADHLALSNNIQLQRKTFPAESGEGTICGHKVIIARPLTFMNRSGGAVGALIHNYNIAVEDIIVIHDDLDIDFGRLKIKTRGGSAGHRGIISIIEELKTDVFLRIRVGIGKPADSIDSAGFVLQNFTGDEQNQLPGIIHKVQQCIETLLIEGSETAMNLIHAT